VSAVSESDVFPVPVSHLDKLYWPHDGLTKGDMLRYYRTMAPVMLSYLSRRPVTLRVFPDGIAGPSYYRRDLPNNAPEWLHSASYLPESTKRSIQVPLVDDAAGLLWFANAGAIEFHPWGSRVPNLNEPDLVFFDLDPGDRATFADVCRAATRVGDVLERQGFPGYPKTSGGRGLHVVVPLAPGSTYDAVRAWVAGIAEELAAADPNLVGVAHGATHRGSLVTIDHARNSVGANMAAPYTLRARPGAPVSTPVTWAELERGDIRPELCTLRSVPERVQQVGDLFRPLLDAPGYGPIR
jgi:bifunctional non-homologous end joining protein LigD